jgi:hypothetical protein
MPSTITETKAVQPDISYHPDFEKYQLRIERLKPQTDTTGRPPAFPKELKGPLALEKANFKDDRDWTFSLNDEQRKEIQNALLHFKC